MTPKTSKVKCVDDSTIVRVVCNKSNGTFRDCFPKPRALRNVLLLFFPLPMIFSPIFFVHLVIHPKLDGKFAQRRVWPHGETVSVSTLYSFQNRAVRSKMVATFPATRGFWPWRGRGLERMCM